MSHSSYLENKVEDLIEENKTLTAQLEKAEKVIREVDETPMIHHESRALNYIKKTARAYFKDKEGE